MAHESAPQDEIEAQQPEEFWPLNMGISRHVLDIMPVGVWVVNETGQILYGNPASQKIWAGAKYVGPQLYSEYKAWWPSTGKPLEPNEWGASRAIQTGESSFDEEIEIECFDHTRKIILNTATPLFDAQNQICGAIVINQDITLRKQAEKRQNLFAEILNILNDPPVLNDAINHILVAIQRATGFDAVGIRLRHGDDYPYLVQNGFSNDFLLTENSLFVHNLEGSICKNDKGHYLLGCTCGLVISGHTDPNHPLFTTGGSFWTNYSLPILDLPPDQDPRFHPRNKCIHEGYLSVALIPIRANEEIVGLLQLNDRRSDCFTLDMIHFFERISTSIGVALIRKQTEDALRVKNLAIQSAISAITTADLEGKLNYVNTSFLKLWGYDHPAEVLGKPVQQFWQESQKAAEVVEALSIHGTWVGEMVAQRRDGSFFDVHIAASMALDIAGHPVCMLASFEDITQRKRALAELQETNAQLQTAIQHANQMACDAQSANISKSVFLANMSHELRTPMNGVIGMTRFLLDTPLSPQQRLFAQMVQTSGESLLAILNDILDFSKIEADKLELEAIPFDLRITIEDTVQMLALRAHEKGLEFICHLAPQLETFLEGDPGRLRQILVNLGSNAIKFTQSGEVVITVQKIAETPRQLTLRFQVRDTGIGIPSDKIPMLFNAFQQLDASTTRKYGGTGLGLAISKRLVEMMGGTIGASSEAGKGTTFWFTTVFAKQSQAATPAAPLPALLRGTHILIVDDNETSRLVLAEQLASWGVRHQEVQTGIQALQHLQNALSQGDPFQVILIDHNMPEMDGQSLALMIKANPFLSHIKMVLLISQSIPGDTKKIQEIGFVCHLVKPIKQSILFECLTDVLGVSTPPSSFSENPSLANPTQSVMSETFPDVRILVADDNEINQMVMVAILEKFGLFADVVSDGQKALQALKMSTYDLVFMDVQMPEMDGIEATQRIRSGVIQGINPSLPIIAMTALAMKDDRGMCLAAGMDDYIAKPFSSEDVVKILKKWLAKKNKELIAGSKGDASTRPNPPPEIFDAPGLLERVMGDNQLVQRLITSFIHDFPKKSTDLKTALAQDLNRDVEKIAHSLKGVALTIGADRMGGLFAKIENLSEAGDMGSIESLLSSLDNEFTLLKNAMESFLHSSTTP